MPKLTELQELDAAIRLAATDAEGSVTTRKLAEAFYSENRKLIAHVADEWILDRLAMLLGKHRVSLRRVADPQYVMEFALGLSGLPAKVRLRNGALIDRSQMTTTQVRTWLTDLRKKKGKSIVQAERMLELMQKNARHGGVPVRWGDVARIESEAVAKGEAAEREAPDAGAKKAGKKAK